METSKAKVKEYPKLPVEFKQKWIGALRSGDYKQGYDILYDHNTDSFCCLGVACLVAGVERKDMNRSLIPTDNPIFSKVPVILTDDRCSSHLTRMNDEAGNNFIEIAEWIETNL